MCKPTGEAVFVGINSSDDAFYGETPEFLDQLRKYKIMNIEMESSALYTIGHLRGGPHRLHLRHERQPDQSGGYLYRKER